jgi:serine/threonine protein kinase
MPTREQPSKIGKYEIISTLGRGGMGVVYMARDPMIDRIVAVKTILVGADASDDEGLLDRLHMEARSAGRLQHPNIVTVYDFGDQDQMSYIVMEYVEGVNLAKVIDEHRPLPLNVKISILLQMADGLAYAHEHGVVHRDMKPSNVCITARGTAKILDFGLARFDNTRLTKTGYMAGTIAYMSPERLSGETGPKDDIFALGAIAYELLTYQRAFKGTMAPEVIGKIIAPGPAPKPSDVIALPPEVDAIVQKALARDIDDRYESAAVMADDLRHLLHSESLRDFMAETEGPTVNRPMQEFFGGRPSANPYSAASSGKTASGPPQPTLQVANVTQAATVHQKKEASTVIVPDVKTSGAHTDPELGVTQMAAQPTQIVPDRTPPRRARGLAIGVGLAVVIGAAYFVVVRKPAEPPKQPPVEQRKNPPVTPVPQPANPLAESSQLQLQTAKSLSDQVGRLTLSGNEIVRFTQAKTRIAAAQQKIDAKDYETGSRLVGDAINDLQSVLMTNGKRPVPTPTPQPHPRPQPQPQPPPAPVPQPVPAPVPPPVPVPAPVPQPQPQPQPRPEPPEKQITAFMHQLAAAYQSKDVGFFREHALNFDDKFAAAIRNSPSVRVELQIEHIDVQDPQHAVVSVRRTDVFPDGGMPPAVQPLAYHLEHTASGWQLASISRR